MQQDAMQTKEKIISLLRLGGPSLPVHIAKGTGLSILFASAFLSELFYEKKIMISNLKVGNSPLYFLPGQEPQLERFFQYLKSKEKEAFLLLKEKKFLKDEEQEPAIRVALREIKDFAIAFKENDEIYWRYFTVPEEEFAKEENLIVVEEIKEEPKVILEEPEKDLGIFEPLKDEEAITHRLRETLKDEEEEVVEVGIGEKENEEEVIEEKEKPVKKERKKTARKKMGQKQDEKFFNKIKEYLSERNVEIVDIQSFNKSDLVLKVNEDGEEKLLIAYNKKKITIRDLLKAYKKSFEAGIQYFVLSFGEPSKNLKDLISAIKDLSKIEKVE